MKDPSSRSSTSRAATRRVAGAAHGAAKGWARKVWDVRGGGLYAVGYALTFVWFEIKTFAGDIADADGVGDFFTGQLTEWAFRIAIESFLNMVSALMWPVYVVQFSPPIGAIALGLAFIAFPRYFKQPVERWLFGEQPADESEDLQAR